jgi:MFS family permease
MSQPHRLPGLILVCAGALMGPLDTAVNVAFPSITGAFGLPLRDIQWIVLAFAVTQSVLTLASGRLGDLYGHRRIFALGMAGCALAHLAAGFAPSYAWLVGLRVIQGAAVGLAMACAPALATLLYPPEQKRRIVAIYVTSFSFGLALGPLLGGLLIDWLGWPGVFWFRAPIALLVLLGLPLLADVRAAPHADPADARSQPEPSETGLTRREKIAFFFVQFDSLFINFAGFSILLLVPYALTAWPQFSVTQAGLLIALYPGGSLLGGLLTGRLGARLTSLTLIRIGLGCASLGLLLVALAVTAHSALLLGLPLAIAGIGLGIFQVGYTDATTSLLPARHRGIAGAMVNVTRLLGILVGVSGISAMHAALQDHQITIAITGAMLLTYTTLAMFRKRAAPRPMAGPGV